MFSVGEGAGKTVAKECQKLRCLEVKRGKHKEVHSHVSHHVFTCFLDVYHRLFSAPTDRCTPWQRWCWRLLFQVKNIFSGALILAQAATTVSGHSTEGGFCFFSSSPQPSPTCSSLLSPCWQSVASCYWSPTCRLTQLTECLNSHVLQIWS